MTRFSETTRPYFDKNGSRILAGMLIRHDDGQTERVYACGENDLGIPANNPDFLTHHPDWPEEFYTLSQIGLREWSIVSEEDQ